MFHLQTYPGRSRRPALRPRSEPDEAGGHRQRDDERRLHGCLHAARDRRRSWRWSSNGAARRWHALADRASPPEHLGRFAKFPKTAPTPAAARPSAIPLPTPRLVPVTSETFPLKSGMVNPSRMVERSYARRRLSKPQAASGVLSPSEKRPPKARRCRCMSSSIAFHDGSCEGRLVSVVLLTIRRTQPGTRLPLSTDASL